MARPPAALQESRGKAEARPPAAHGIPRAGGALPLPGHPAVPVAGDTWRTGPPAVVPLGLPDGGPPVSGQAAGEGSEPGAGAELVRRG